MNFLWTIANFSDLVPFRIPFQGYWANGGRGTDFTDINNPPAVTLNPINATLSGYAMGVYMDAVLGTSVTFSAQVGFANTGDGAVITPGLLESGASLLATSVGRPANTGELSTKNLGLRVTGTATSPAVRVAAACTLATPFENWSVITSQFTESVNLSTTGGNSDFFQALGSTDGRITESQVQLPWPGTSGTFRYFMAVRQTLLPNGNPTFRYRLRINGATVIEMVESSFTTLSGLTQDDTSTATIAPDDLVCFSTHSDGPYVADNSSRIYYAIGFLPS